MEYTIESIVIKEEIVKSFAGTTSTRKIAEKLIGKYRADWVLADLESITDKYVSDCLKRGAWRLKRQVSDTKSEAPAGWKACKVAAENILKASPGHERALELLQASVVFNNLSSLLSTARADLKKPTTVTAQPEENELVQETRFAARVWSNLDKAREIITLAKSDEKATKEWLIECLDFVAELLA